jgi:outer membrane cobalamin receptor
MKKKLKIKMMVLMAMLMGCLPFANAEAPASSAVSSEEGLEYLLFEEIPIVISAGFFKQEARRAPGYSTIISEQNINDSSARTLADLIDYYVPGMSVGAHERHGLLLGTRGILIDNNAKTLVMLDGQGINHRQHFGYQNPLSLPLVGDLKSVEVVDGPGAIVHGSGAINGFINLIPKNGKDNAGFTSSAELGSTEELWKLESGYGKAFSEDNNLYVYAGVVEAKGVDAKKTWDRGTYAVNKFNSLDNPGAQVHGFADPSYKIAAYWNKGKFNLNTFYQNVTNLLLGVDTTNRVGLTKKDLSFQTQEFGFRPKYILDFNDTTSLDIVGSAEISEHARKKVLTSGGGEAHAELKLVGKTTQFKKQSLAVGCLAGNRQFKAGKGYFHGTYNGGAHESVDGSWNEFAVFMEDVVSLNEKWNLSGGVRYDKVAYSELTTGGSVVTPPEQGNPSWRAASSYSFNQNTTAKLSYQQGFRYPDAAYYVWHTYFSNILESVGGGRLKPLTPETMDSYEFNFQQKIEPIKLIVDLNLYQNTYTDMLSWYTYTSEIANNPAYARANARAGWFQSFANTQGSFKSQGFEIVGTWNPSESILLKSSYGYSAPEDLSNTVNNSIGIAIDGTKEWKRYPTHLFKNVLSTYFLDNKLMLSLAWLYNSGHTLENSGLNSIYGKDRNVFDIGLRYQIQKNISAKFTVQNLTKTDVPPMAFWGTPYEGALGSENRYYYLSANVKI